MTALVFVVVLIAGWLWFVTNGPFLFDGVTIYVAGFIATLASATVAAVVSHNRRNILAALVLIANFAGSHFAWQAADPILIGAILDLITAAWFILVALTRWEIAVGSLFLISAATAGATAFGLLPSHLNRPYEYIAWSYPDIAAIIGHVANCTLGAASGDAGKLVRLWALDTRDGTVGAGRRRSLGARLAAMAARSLRGR